MFTRGYSSNTLFFFQASTLWNPHESRFFLSPCWVQTATWNKRQLSEMFSMFLNLTPAMNESASTVQSHPKILVILYGSINNIKQTTTTTTNQPTNQPTNQQPTTNNQQPTKPTTNNQQPKPTTNNNSEIAIDHDKIQYIKHYPPIAAARLLGPSRSLGPPSQATQIRREVDVSH